MNDIPFLVLKVVTSIAVALITGYVVPALKNYIIRTQNQQVQDIIKTAVKAAEQTITGTKKGAIKKENVLAFVTDWLEDKGFNFSSAQLERMIEECVYLMNNSAVE